MFSDELEDRGMPAKWKPSGKLNTRRVQRKAAIFCCRAGTAELLLCSRRLLSALRKEYDRRVRLKNGEGHPRMYKNGAKTEMALVYVQGKRENAGCHYD
jgi:hypothetical protein